MSISFSFPANRGSGARGAGVTAVLGPTNTGKTHLAIERMLGHSSGMIGLPLRLLAREVYNKVAERVGSDVIYWSTIHAPAGEQGIGPTATYLLSKRPCRVIIETDPRRGREPAPAAV